MLLARRPFIGTTATNQDQYGRGVPELHAALIDYLDRVRGTSARPENVVICSGYGPGVSLVVRVLAARGARRLVCPGPRLLALDPARTRGTGWGLASSATSMEAVGMADATPSQPSSGRSRRARQFRSSRGRRVGDAIIGVFVRAGLVPSTYLLTTRGRKTGRPLTHPATVVENEGQRWLVAPYGAVSWVHNARAAGRVSLHRARGPA